MTNLNPYDYKNGEPIHPVTTDGAGKPTPIPQPKVIAATGGTVIGGAIAGVAIWITETAANIDIPGEVEVSIVVIVSTIATFVAGYIKRPSAKIN